MNNIVKQPMLPNTIHFHHTMNNDRTEVMRITRTGVWVNPDMSIDDTAKAVLAALDSQIKVLVLAERNRTWTQEHWTEYEHSIVAGALFDFMGWLTSRKERIVLSSADNASPAVEVITEFAKMRGLSLDDAKVQNWQDSLRSNT